MAYTLGQFAARLVAAAAVASAGNREGLEEAAAMLEDAAKSIFGSGDLAPNAPATIDRKGFDSPGVETGEARDSIQHNADSFEAYVGSNNEKVKWLEYGTNKAGSAWGGPNPPRPSLGIAAVRKGDEAAEIVGRDVFTKIVSAI